MDRIAHRALSPIVALLTLAVLLVGVFAIHSEVTGHDQHTMVPAVSAAAGQAHTSLSAGSISTDSLGTGSISTGSISTGMPGLGIANTGTLSMVAVSLAAPVVAAMSSGMLDGLLDCALMAICVLLLIVVTNIVFTRRPDFLRQVSTAGRQVLAIVQTVAVPAAGPSLTLLSIRRV